MANNDRETYKSGGFDEDEKSKEEQIIKFDQTMIHTIVDMKSNKMQDKMAAQTVPPLPFTAN